jgi:dynein assembly factor 2
MTSTPKYVIKYRYEQRDLPLQTGNADPCRPTSMVVEISLPEMSSAKGIDLDVLEHLLTLESVNTPVAYKLVLKLPYPVHDDQGSAKFDKSQHVLAVTLPVKSKEAVSRLVSVDSGIGLEFVNIEQSEQSSQEEQDLDSGLVLDSDVAKDDGLDDEDLEFVDFEVERSMPPYVCNIYEGLMVVTMALRNVVADSLNKTVLKDGKGYYLTFHTMGEGFVPIYYGFCLSFDFEAAQAEGDCHLDDLEVEVWNNNMIVQLSMPKLGCQTYQVGNHPLELGEPLHLPRLKAVKNNYLLGRKNGHNVMKKPSVEGLDSDDNDDDEEENEKERHSSGDSNDSAISFSSVPTSPTKLNEEERLDSPSRFLVIPSDLSTMKDCNLRGILRRPRCSSESATGLLRMMSSPSGCSSTASSGTIIEENENELESCGDSMGSKKSVRFNEVVLRQVYRKHASILGQKHKNQKKAEQKRRKAMRRASEGDVPSPSSGSLTNTFSADESEDQDHTNDSGLASEDIDLESSSLEANNNKKIVEKTKQNGKIKGKRSKVASRFLDESQNSDLIFNLDFY